MGRKLICDLSMGARVEVVSNMIVSGSRENTYREHGYKFVFHLQSQLFQQVFSLRLVVFIKYSLIPFAEINYVLVQCISCKDPDGAFAVDLLQCPSILVFAYKSSAFSFILRDQTLTIVERD